MNPQPHVLFVNGYGAGDSRDQNMSRYLKAVHRHIMSLPGDDQIELYLCGGYTNRTDLSEAHAMANWFAGYGLPRRVQVILIENTCSARENIEEFRRRAGNPPTTIFCEWSRRFKMRWLARRSLRSVEVVGVPFDPRSLRLDRQLVEFGAALLEIAALHSIWAEELRRYFRQRRVQEARRESMNR